MHPIRPLSSADSLQGLTSLLHRAYERVGEMGLNYTTVDRSVEVTAERIAGGPCYIAEMDGRLVGTIVVKPTEAQSECEYITRSGVAAAQQFVVDPDAQGRGLERALLQACEAWARARGSRSWPWTPPSRRST